MNKYAGIVVTHTSNGVSKTNPCKAQPYTICAMPKAAQTQEETRFLLTVGGKLFSLETYDKIILSPGPGIPDEAGLLMDVVRTYAPRKPMLGVCLGHQAIGEAFGARLTNLERVFHGIQSPLILKNDDASTEHLPAIEPDYIFQGLESGIPVGRYHSWIVDKKDFPSCLAVTALSPEGHIMALRHRTLDIHGIQFHPESVLTPDGRHIMRNWLQA